MGSRDGSAGSPSVPAGALIPDSRGAAFARASLVLLGLAWCVPFLQPHHSFPLTAFYSEWAAFALGLAAACLLLRRESWRDAALPLVALAPLGLLLVLGLQVALGRVPYPEQALTAALYLLWAVLIVQLGRVLRQASGLVTITTTLAWFPFAGGLASVLAGLVQHYGVWDALAFLVADKTAHAVYGNLSQPNHFAAYLAAGLASAGYLYARGRLNGSVAGVCVVLFTFLIALSGSRSPWLYLLLFAVLAAITHRQQGTAVSRRLALFAWCLIPAFVLAQFAALLPLLQPDEGRVITSAQRLFEMASGARARLALAHEAWQMLLGAPWLGAGWGQFPWSHFVHLATTGATDVPEVCSHAHNILLQLLAETGIAGALVVAGPVIVWLADLRKVRLDLEWWWLLAVLAVLGTHSMLEYPLWYAYFLGMAALLLGLGSDRALRLGRPGAARLAVALAVLAGTVNLVAILEPYRDFERLVFDPRQRAAREMNDQDYAAAMVRLYREPMLVPYVELVLAHVLPVNAEKLEEKLELSARAMRFAPVNAVVYRHALLLALAGRGAEALRALESAIKVHPLELRETLPELRELARRHPDEFAPLLELASAKSAERRARDTP